MVLIVHGFPDNISALRFEWAWQEPKNSRRLRDITSIQRKKSNESHFDYHFRILTEMINSPPWHRLPLKVRWLENDFCTSFPVRVFWSFFCILFNLFPMTDYQILFHQLTIQYRFVFTDRPFSATHVNMPWSNQSEKETSSINGNSRK